MQDKTPVIIYNGMIGHARINMETFFAYFLFLFCLQYLA